VTRISSDLRERLADALHLTQLERRLLQHLAEGRRRARSMEERLPSSLSEILDHFEPYPAYVTDARTDFLAWNRAMCAVFAPLDTMPARERNVLRILFANPTVRRTLVNWEAIARYTLARFRVAHMSMGPAARFDEIVSDLTEVSPEFRVWWRRQDVKASEVIQIRVDHPHVGLMVLNYTPLRVLEGDHCIMLSTPDPNTDSRSKLERLAARAEPSHAHAM
jgi:hypothetical protein